LKALELVEGLPMTDQVRRLAVLSLAGLLSVGCANTGWRALRIDATSEDSFGQSVAEFQQQLPYKRLVLFEYSLVEIGGRFAAPGDFRQLDGLGYGEVVDLAGPVAREKYLAHFGPAAAAPIGSPPNAGFTGNTNPFGPWPGAPVGPQTPR
jgi:hypothetical protein